MKKILTKLNMAIVLIIMILFANVVFADGLSDEELREIVSDIESYATLREVVKWHDDSKKFQFISINRNSVEGLANQSKYNDKIKSISFDEFYYDYNSSPTMSTANGITIIDKDNKKYKIEINLFYKNDDGSETKPEFYGDRDDNTDTAWTSIVHEYPTAAYSIDGAGNYAVTVLPFLTDNSQKDVYISYKISSDGETKEIVKDNPVAVQTVSEDKPEEVQRINTETISTTTPELGDITKTENEEGNTVLNVTLDGTEKQPNGFVRTYFKVPKTGWYFGTIYDDNNDNLLFKEQGILDIKDVDYSTMYNGAVDNGRRIYALSSERTYYIDIPEDKIGTYELILENAPNNGVPACDYSDSERQAALFLVQNLPDSGESFFAKIERLLSQFIFSIAKVLNWLVGKIAGQQLTLDDIVFNRYSEIRLDFFETDIGGNKVTGTSQLVMDFREPVNKMFSFFRTLVLVGYMVILVYVGIKMMLSSTTAKSKAIYKEMFMCWITGIMILFFMPYFMKIVIALDDALVTYIGDSNFMSSTASAGSNSHAVITSNGNGMSSYLETDFDNAIDFDNAEDYMSRVGSIAKKYRRIGYSVSYLVLSWQVVALLVYYYKRIFVTAFLIMIFPFIAFTYVWDKLNDGKSQALSLWVKEFCMTVFVQTFHAIVYIFIVNTIYATMNTTGSGGIPEPDFILLMIASSFLFTGEEILKNMFGGGGAALGNASSSAAMVAVVVGGATRAGTRVVKGVAGRDGIIRKPIRNLGQIRMYRYLRGTPKYDSNGNTIPEDQRMTRMELIARNQEHAKGVNAYLPKDGNITQTISEAGEMLYSLNNSKDAEEFAGALKEYRRLRDARNNGTMTPEEIKMFDEMMKKSAITPAQLQHIDRAMLNAAAEAAMLSGDMDTPANTTETKRIAQTLRIEIEAIFPAKDSEGNELRGIKNKMATKVTKAVLINMKEMGVANAIKPVDLNEVWNKEVEAVKKESNKIKFAKYLTKDDKKRIRAKLDNRADELTKEYKKKKGAITPEEEKKVKSVARRFAVLELRGTGEIYDFDLMNAVDIIERDENKDISNILLEISNVDGDIENLKSLIALKIKGSENRTYRKDVLAIIDRDYKPGTYGNDKAEEIVYAREVEKLVEQRKNEIITEFKNAGNSITKKNQKEINEIAESLAKLEYYETDLLTTSQIDKAKEIVTENKAIAEHMLRHTNITETRVDDINSRINQRRKLGDWAFVRVAKTEENTVNNPSAYLDPANRNNINPLSEIYEIMEAAQKGRVRDESRRMESVSEMLTRATRPGANAEILDRKRDVVRRINQSMVMGSKAFAEKALEMDEFNQEVIEPQREYTLDGYTKEDLKELENAAVWNTATSVAQAISDITVAPVATMTGMALGAALTEDFMPVEEVIIGSATGYNTATNFSDKTIPSLTRQEERDKKIKELKDRVEKRAKADDELKLKAREAFENMANDRQEALDQTLVFTGANANMHIESDGSLSVTVNLMASNAEYYAISENPGNPGGWLPFQESVYYKFSDRSPTTPHTLYIYVRDKFGNTLGKRIDGIRS